ncbi:MAG TPA: hypothetical protein VG317_04125 [Pseudonocardiaceae bacterium]|nr:hypothetical protein [Pseudonocardiaceae bacterium]
MVRLSLKKGLGIAAVGAAAVLATTLSTGSANADTGTMSATYQVTGNAHVAKAGFDSKLGPGSFAATLDTASGQFTGDFKLPATKADFSFMGMPVTADVNLVEGAKVTGKLTDGAADAKINFKVLVSNVTVSGQSLNVGDNCTSDGYATIDVKSDSGFSVINGGTLSSTFTLPPYANCGWATSIINSVIPGPNNTLSLTLGQAQIQH